MAQQKPAGKTDSKETKKKQLAEEEARRKKREKVEKYSVTPDFWDTLFDAIPPWGDEIAAIVLIVFGMVSFMSLFDVASDASLPRAWSKALTDLFGYGGVIVAAAIFVLGIVILLPKIGVRISFPPHRILALEIAFISVL